jgi:FHS family L-fucose permease-like MFS transporter
MATMLTETAAPLTATAPHREHRGAVGVLAALFFAIGFLTCLNDIIIPHFKTIFALNYTGVMLIQFCFFTAYFVVSVPSGIIVHKVGYKNAILLGLGVAALGCFGFFPAAALPSYPLFLAAFFVLASGFTLLQVAVNPYAAILGSPETASSRLTLTQAFNSFGTTIAPVIGSHLILTAEKGPVDPAVAAQSVQGPYLAFAAILVAMGGALALFRLPDARPAEEKAGEGDSVWSHAPLAFGVLAIFVYVGAEVSIGSVLVNFLQEPAVGALDQHTAASWVAFYWGGAMVGRFVGVLVLRNWLPPRVLASAGAAAFLLVGATIIGSGHFAMFAILSVGLCNSIMFPTIFTLAIRGLGARTGEGSGMLCMAIVGGAIVPLMEGALADKIGLHTAFLVPLVCYAYIVWYGLVGSQLRFRGAAGEKAGA